MKNLWYGKLSALYQVYSHTLSGDGGVFLCLEAEEMLLEVGEAAGDVRVGAVCAGAYN